MNASLSASERDLIAFALSAPLESIARLDIVKKQYDAGEVVAHEGQVGDITYVVLEGSMRTVARDSRQRLVTLSRHEQGAVLRAGLQDLRQHDVQILAVDCCSVALISNEFLGRRGAENQDRATLAAGSRDETLSQLKALSKAGGEIAAVLQDAGEIVTRDVAPGEILFSEGAKADFACIVLSGRFEAVQWDGGVARVLGASGPGTFVGELGVLEGKPRAATVRALEQSTVLVLSAEVTRNICTATGVAALTSALRAGYALFGRGIAYSVIAPGSDEDRVITTIRLADTRTVTVARTLASAMVTAHDAIPSETMLSSPDGRARIGVANGVPVLVEGYQDWSDLPSVMDYLLSGKPLEGWRQAAFEANGTLLFPQDSDLGSDTTVCACTATSAATIQSHAEAGATTLEDIERVCGAGGVCGGCRNRLATLLGRENFTLCRTEVTSLCEGAVRIRLEPISCELPDVSPGQHVSIEGLIDGAWVSRSYTVVEGRPEMIECGVKIEQQGLFSPWLAAGGDSVLTRVSTPQGEPMAEEGDPLLCIVAGIGVTPAVAALRTIATRRRIHVTYIYRGRAAAAYLDELEMASEAGRISFTAYDTTVEGRPDLSALTDHAIDASGASEALVCGPVAWAEEVTTLLSARGITVRKEVFVHAGFASGPEMVCPGAWRESTRSPKEVDWQQFTVEEPGSLDAEAKSFLQQFFTENQALGGFDNRWGEVKDEISRTGSYRQTNEELTFGARLAWRNAARCIGRLYWSGLNVRDCRHLSHPDEIATALFEHLDLAYNDGNLTPLMTVFDPGAPGQPAVRLWNSQLMRYAGYQKTEGKIVGDPAQLRLTRSIEALGWHGAGGKFDLLPIVIEVAGHKPRYYEIPQAQRKEVRIRHPQFPGIEELDLKWYAVPAVSDMALDCGGILYQCAPFNGWYMATEIGARNFTDVDRYNLSFEIAEKIGLDTRRERTLWRDKALTAMTEAVLWSFEAEGVKIVDHYSASLEFLQFCRNEQDVAREVHGHWPWLVPPIGGSATPLFLDNWKDSEIKPALVMQEPVCPSA